MKWTDYHVLMTFPGLGLYHMGCRMTGHKALYVVDDFGVMQEAKMIDFIPSLAN